MLGFTGSWCGQKVSVMGTGMGMPSMGLYSYELIHFYGVKNLIRIGSCGAIQPSVNIHDIIVAMSASHDSGYGAQYRLPGTFAPTASFNLLRRAVEAAETMGIPHAVGPIISSDVFYSDDATSWQTWAKMGILAVEMEAAALYMNAAHAGVNALCLLTVSDSLLTGAKLDAAERETSFEQMVRMALALV
jgi:purine-nucleoside phosphorylase